MKLGVSTAAIVATFLLTCGGIATQEARAAGPTAVYEAEGPGHTPLRGFVFVNPPCDSQPACTLKFGKVPEHKRLVVTHLSCSVKLAYPGILTEAEFYSDKVSNVVDYLPMTQLYSNAGLGVTDYVVNITENMAFGPGETPTIFFAEANGGAFPYSAGGSCSITGYYAKD